MAGPAQAQQAGNLPAAAAPASAQQSELIRRAEYVARLGDCIACHTAPDGTPMAGGLELKTPFGALDSANITPDPQTGIGNCCFEEVRPRRAQGSRR